MSGYLHCFYNSLGVVAVDVKYRSLYHGCYRSTIIGAAGIGEIGGKPNLVIDYKMYRTTGIIPFKVTHLQHLVHNTLSGNRCITMN